MENKKEEEKKGKLGGQRQTGRQVKMVVESM
jgi:hypothetical protein